MKARNYTNNHAWLLVLLLWPLAGLVLLVGCKRADATPDGDSAYIPVIYRDRSTGCEYLSPSNSGITPRIAADGKTHMGCKGGQQ